MREEKQKRGNKEGGKGTNKEGRGARGQGPGIRKEPQNRDDRGHLCFSRSTETAAKKTLWLYWPRNLDKYWKRRTGDPNIRKILARKIHDSWKGQERNRVEGGKRGTRTEEG